MITIDLNKAREITHEKRRIARAEEFKPFDEVIALQLPGQDANQAETQRQLIRDKYAAIQLEIDACEDIDSLKTIHDTLGAS